MAKPSRTVLTNDSNRVGGVAPMPVTRQYSSATAGSLTATQTFIFTVEKAGTITDAWMSFGVLGVDATNPLQYSLAITNLNAGTAATPLAVTSTAAVLTKAYVVAGSSTFATTVGGTRTGVTAPVIDTTKNVVAKGDIIKAVATITRTASPGTEFSDIAVGVVVTETSDWDPTVG